jgi:transposase, IS5 family
LLAKHSLTEQLFRDAGLLLTARGLLLHQGTVVDATIISTPPSTKNRDQARDPDMSHTKKRNTWHFGMKAHIGVDLDSGLVHTLATTTARESDQNVLPQLLHGAENEVLGDRGYGSKADRALAGEARIVLQNTAHRITRGKELTLQQELENKVIASLRAIVEFPFRSGVMRWWGIVGWRKTPHNCTPCSIGKSLSSTISIATDIGQVRPGFAAVAANPRKRD